MNIFEYFILWNLGFRFLYSLSVWWHFMVWNLKLEKKIILWNFFFQLFLPRWSHCTYFAKKWEEYFFFFKIQKNWKRWSFYADSLSFTFRQRRKRRHLDSTHLERRYYTFDRRLHWHYKNYIKFLNKKSKKM